MPLDTTSGRAVSESLELALNASGYVGMWETDLATKTVHLFGPFAARVGVGAEDGARGVTLSRFLESIDPEDRERVADLVDEAHRTSGRFESEFRTIGIDGKTHWISARGQVETDAEGRGIRCLGVAIDVTDTRAAAKNSDVHVVRTVSQIIEALNTARSLVMSLNLPILKSLIDLMLFELGRQIGKGTRPRSEFLH